MSKFVCSPRAYASNVTQKLLNYWDEFGVETELPGMCMVGGVIDMWPDEGEVK